MLKIVQIDPTEASSLQSQLYILAKNNDSKLHLKVLKVLENNELIQLEAFIAEQKQLPFTKISLKLDLNSLKNKQFLKILEQLNSTLISAVELIFPREEMRASKNEIIPILTTQIAPKLFYPLKISMFGAAVMPLRLPDLEKIIIANIQKANNEKNKTVDRVVKAQRTVMDPADPMAKKIKLKEFIRTKKVQSENLASYVSLEIQHVEAVEQQMVQQQQEVVEVQANLELHAIQEYSARLIDFDAFTAPNYKNKVIEYTGSKEATEFLYRQLQQELFANLPQAITYISPDAAEQLALNLPALVTLNKENLPDGFILKYAKQGRGELVLDYEVHFENERSNPFTPQVPDVEWEPIYKIVLHENDIRMWIDDEALALVFFEQLIPEQLINLWIKYGNSGVTAFFKELKTATQEQPQMTGFLLRSYLKHLPQWDHLYENPAFFASVKCISHYDEEKLKCLKRFLQYTGSSRYDLSKTVAAFEVFWNELSLLCIEHKVAIAGINKANWTAPVEGNPVVYMERMLFILKNARSFKDQFALLNGITLDNYAAYYASRYEGFTAVSQAMQLRYDAKQQNKEQFNKNFKLYRVEQEHLFELYALVQRHSYFFDNIFDRASGEPNPYWLVDGKNELPQPLHLETLQKAGLAIPFKEKLFAPPYQVYSVEPNGVMKLLFVEKPRNISNEEFRVASFRFIGTRTAGITAGSLIEQLGERNFYPKQLLALLLFVSHERFIENQPLAALFQQLDNLFRHSKVINSSVDLLARLYQRDIKLNQVEGLQLFQSVSSMNSQEFTQENIRISKVACIKKLLRHLEQNKFATLKLFDLRSKKANVVWPFLYALDTADYLAKDPMVAASYRDDLLIFAELINTERDEVYYHRRTLNIEIIKDNMNTVQHYLHEAAAQEKPNNLHYAIQLMIHTQENFSFAQFLAAGAEIAKLPAFDSKKVEAILVQKQFKIGAKLPEIFTKDNADLKGVMIPLIIQLNALKNKPPQKSTAASLQAELASLSIAELQLVLQKAWEESGTLLSVVGKVILRTFLKTTKALAIKSAFDLPNAQGLLKIIAERIDTLSGFDDYSDFLKVNRIAGEAKKIAHLFREMMKNSYVVEQEQGFVALFAALDFSQFDSETLHSLLSLLIAMPERNYLSLLQLIFADKSCMRNKGSMLELLNLLSALNTHYFPLEYLHAISKLALANLAEKDFNLIREPMIRVFDKDNKDPVLEFLMTHSELSYKQIRQILSLSEDIENNRDKLSELLIYLTQTKTLDSLLKELIGSGKDKQKKILEILSKAQALNRVNTRNNKTVDYSQLTILLNGLSVEALGLLYAFYETTPVSAECLFNALKKPDRAKDFQKFLLEFEKAPFGARDLQKQFALTEVERVINQFKDLLNNSIYTYQYRKQMMEAFLFVNEQGTLVKEWTNAEIKSFFADLKAKKIVGLTPFQNRLLALSLMREAMYRSTGEFPYSTQIIALIDGMMHQGDFISNIDTGQGKSLIDVMKAALLWLDSDRVDLTTSSLVDAKRDIANYAPFLKLLGVPYSITPISSSSPIAAFQKNGINFTTFAQLSLFFAKAKVSGNELDTPKTVVSLVANESDYSILDDRIIYHFATADGSGLRSGQEWIYYGINEFVMRPEFIANDKTTAADDLADLKMYLTVKAKELKKSGKLVNKFSDAQYLTWMESALMVRYVLKENVDYVIPEVMEKKLINGTEVRSRVVKVLLKDGKVSPDSTFGNGMQQLLYARLNKERGYEREGVGFFIEPQNKTIISRNNENLIDYYRARKGFIWGSSGTVGSPAEIKEQYHKYGFEFSKAEPHQKNRVKFNIPIFKDDEKAQFNQLISLLTAEVPNNKSAASIVFCRDINTAIRLFQEFEKQNPKKFPLQCYTGLGKEEDFINNASKPGMITITTSALGRNTDIHYDKIQGLRVWHTFIDSIRGADQKSGRTGRQGSPGEVNFVLNAQEFAGKSIQQIQAEIDVFAAKERQVNEVLYTVLDYLLAQVYEQPEEQFTKGSAAFVQDYWPEFSAKTEALFKESRREVVYDQETFLQKTLASFNHMMKVGVKTAIAEMNLETLKQAIVKKHPPKEAYKPYLKIVKVKECIPPVVIAYHLLPGAEEEKQAEVTKNAIKKQLEQAFEAINKNTFVRYLCAKPTTQKIIVEAHKEFLTQYVQSHSKKLNVLQRWLGFEGKLNQIASNQNYLLMFYAVVQVSKQPVVELDLIKQAVKMLLEEYLENSWFIRSDRKKWALELQDKINQAPDIDAIIRCLSQTQVEVAQRDIAANKKYMLKPLHLFGHSRYQSTLSRALNLTTSLSGKGEIDNLTKELMPLVTDTLTELTSDELSHKAASKKVDQGNTSVIISALEEALAIKNRKGPSGMIGRQGLFSSKEPAAPQATPNPENKPKST